VLEIIRRRRIAGHILLGGSAVIAEFNKNRDSAERDMDTRFFWETIDRFIEPAADDDVRAQELQAEGLGEMDSYHLAVAERAEAGALITVDDDFEEIATSKCLSKVVVVNPLKFI
jgi:predicted nucleic acid-binding protein